MKMENQTPIGGYLLTDKDNFPPPMPDDLVKWVENTMNKKTYVYVVLIEDRHADADVRVFSQQDVAIRFAWDVAKENAHRPEYIYEKELGEQDEKDGYLLVLRYSAEDDWVTVLKRLVDDPAD